MDTLKAIKTLRAVRFFTARAIPEESLRTILDAGRMSGSGKNRQPWQFIVVKDREMLEALAKCGQYAGHLAGATVGVVIVLTPGTSVVTLFDGGRAAQNMMLAAWSLGIGSCIATLTDIEKVRELLGIPDDRLIGNAISFGYFEEETPEQRAYVTSLLSQRGRKPLEAVVRWERW